MDAVEFVKERVRMCHHGCSNCPANELTGGCDPLETASINLLVQIVEQWSQAHPQKTIMQDFFEKFPNALKDSFGNPEVCPQALGYGDFCCDDTKNNCTVCWSRPLED